MMCRQVKVGGIQFLIGRRPSDAFGVIAHHLSYGNPYGKEKKNSWVLHLRKYQR
jgi:hypothetical protein